MQAVVRIKAEVGFEFDFDFMINMIFLFMNLNIPSSNFLLLLCFVHQDVSCGAIVFIRLKINN